MAKSDQCRKWKLNTGYTINSLYRALWAKCFLQNGSRDSKRRIHFSSGGEHFHRSIDIYLFVIVTFGTVDYREK